MSWPFIVLAAVCGELLFAIAIGSFLRGPLPRGHPAPEHPFEDAADTRVRERVERVIADRSLLIVFQPIVDAVTQAPVGFEALSRLAHFAPQESPEQWFGAAARIGAGIELEFLAARMALDAASELPAGAYLSLNLSPAAIATGRLGVLLAESGWPAHRTVLEITEQESIEDYEGFTKCLAPLRRSGVRVAVDDAGAGYASFRHILALGPDYIKLDRSLISDVDCDPGRRALVTAVTKFAEDIGARVIAEGVETEHEFRTLRHLGVHAVQGYLVGKPDLASAWTRKRDAAAQRLPAATDAAVANRPGDHGTARRTR